MTVESLLSKADLPIIRRIVGARVVALAQDILGADIEVLRRVAVAVIDLELALREPDSREALISLMPTDKKTEFYRRTGYDSTAEDFTASMTRSAKAFFGMTETAIPKGHSAGVGSCSAAYGLFDHQRAAAAKIRTLLTDGPALLHLPTGVGKTRTAMSIVADHLRGNEPTVVVWVASGVELLGQAANEFERTWSQIGNRKLEVTRCWRSADIADCDIRDGIVILGLEKAAAAIRRNPRALDILGARCRLAVFDEAHQAIAPTFHDVTDKLTISPRSRLLGLSATPGRTWADIDADSRLSDYFGGSKVMLELPGYTDPIAGLTEQGYLARPVFRTLLSRPGTEMSTQDIQTLATSVDVPTHILAQLSLDEQWNLKVIEAIQELVTRHQRVMVFAASVAHCRLLTGLLIACGVDADYVTGETTTSQRARVIGRFTNPYGNKPRVLINYNVLTTGFDAPKASAAVIARPTMSLVLYSQMVGRVLRGPRAGGTESCEIVTVVNTALAGFGDVAEAFTNWDDVWSST